MPVHHAAAQGYAQASDSYVKGRPDYPPALRDWLRTAVGIQPGLPVLELGAGTGKFTPLLLDTGAQVLAVDPVPQMLDRLREQVPAATALLGTAEAVPLPAASVAVVVCAQAFHWFANRAALAEIHRVLQPGGRLALVWNVRDARVPWVARLDAIVNAHEGDAPRYRSGQWRQAFPHPGFGPLHEQVFAHAHTGAVDDVIRRRVASTSFISALPAAQRAEVDAQLQQLIHSEPALQGPGPVSVPYRCVAFHCVRQP